MSLILKQNNFQQVLLQVTTETQSFNPKAEPYFSHTHRTVEQVVRLHPCPLWPHGKIGVWLLFKAVYSMYWLAFLNCLQNYPK